MKNIIVALAILFFQTANCQTFNIQKKEILQLVVNHSQQLGTVQQLLLVVNDHDTSNKAILVALEKKNKKWKLVNHPVQASIGRNGFAMPGKKREGDGKSPTGLFALGQLFSYENTINTDLPFIQTFEDDKWIDDSNHPDYNKYIKGTTTATSFEHLHLPGIYYKYCMVIEYNTHPVEKGMGSAIFFHVADEKYSATAGCIAIQESDMSRILRWLKSQMNKAILMGTLSQINTAAISKQ